MARFSEASQRRLSQCRNEIQTVMNLVIPHYDFTVVCGHRGQFDQDEAFRTGMSTLPWPESKHNTWPSHAVDIAPYPIDWDDKESFYHLAGRVLQVADSLGIRLRWGGDWDGDDDFHDQTFMDLCHFELVGEPGDEELTPYIMADGYSITYA